MHPRRGRVMITPHGGFRGRDWEQVAHIDTSGRDSVIYIFDKMGREVAENYSGGIGERTCVMGGF